MRAFLILVLLTATGVLAYLYYSLRREWLQLRSQHEALQREKQLVFDFLHDLGEACARQEKGQQQLLDIVAVYAVRAMGAKSGAIYLLDEGRTRLTAAVVEGFFPPPHPPADFTVTSKVASKSRFLEQLVKAEPIPVGEGILGEVARTGKPVLISDGAADTRVPRFPQDIWRIDTLIAVPLKLRDEVLGVMALVNKNSDTPFTESDLSIFTSLADQATLTLSNARYLQLQQEKCLMDRDLQIARDIQKLLLPTESPRPKHFDIAAINVPAAQVGGDYYDFYPVDENRLAVGIADVSGKGVPGALMMVMCRSVTRSKAAAYRSAAAVLQEVNRLIHPDMKSEMFITMTYALLDSSQRSLTLARAGHEPPLLLRQGGQTIEPLQPRGMALGIDNGARFNSLIEETTVALQPGDVVVFYTDGITEAMDAEGHEFGRQRLHEALQHACRQSSREIVDHILERLKRFLGPLPPHDDMTLVVIKTL